MSIESDLRNHLDCEPALAHGIMELLLTTTTIRSKIKFRAYLSAAQNNLALGWVKVLLDAVTFNPGGHFSTADKKFVAPIAGYYQFNGGATLTSAANNQDHFLSFHVNGSSAVQAKRISSYDFNSVGLGLSDILYLAANDYVELYINNGGANTVDLVTGSLDTFFSGHILSAA